MCRIIVDSLSITDSSLIVEQFRLFHSSLSQSRYESSSSTSTVSNIDRLEPLHLGKNDLVLDVEFTIKDINDVVKTLKLGKSSGHDGLSPEHIKHAGDFFCVWKC